MIMDRHFRTLGWLFTVAGILSVLFSLTWLTIMPKMFSAMAEAERIQASRPAGTRGAPTTPAAPVRTPPPDAEMFRQVFSSMRIAFTAWFIVVLLASIISIVNGWALLARRQWARMLTIVLSILSLGVFPPFGTALGVYGLWAMFQAKAPLAWDDYAGRRAESA
jgi:hypothetical protein